jgi:hypothetical protein
MKHPKHLSTPANIQTVTKMMPSTPPPIPKSPETPKAEIDVAMMNAPQNKSLFAYPTHFIIKSRSNNKSSVKRMTTISHQVLNET